MATPAFKPHFSPEEYLAWEAEQVEKHEYLDGEVFAMAGASDHHNVVSGNLAIALRQHLKGSPYRTLMSQIKLQVVADNSFYYPDVLVTCSARDTQDPLVKREPTLLVEVLSPGTAAYDRGAKFSSYRKLASLQEYVLIDTDTRATDVYRKGADGLWVLHPFAGDQAVKLASVALTITAAVLFDELDVPANAPPAITKPSAPEASVPTKPS